MFPKKILVIKLRALGDTVVLTVALSELRHHFPQAQLDVLVPQEWSEILEYFPGIYKIWPYQKNAERIARIRALTRLGFYIRKEKYDCVINLHASPSSSLLALATGAPLRSVHFHGHQAKNRYSTVPIPGKGQVKSTIERDMDALRALGLHISSKHQPHINLQPSEITQAQHAIEEYTPTTPILGVHLGASRETKRWPIGKFVKLALMWRQKTGGSVFVIPDPTNTDQAQLFLMTLTKELGILDLSQTQRDLLKKGILIPQTAVTLRFLAAILSQLSVLVSGDSGPRHLAVAVGTPTVTLFGPENPFEWHPYSIAQHPYFFIESLLCRKEGVPDYPAWCALKVCTQEGHRCMIDIHVDPVFQKAQSIARAFIPRSL